MGNNKHLVAAGREFAETMSDDTPLIAIAKMMARLSEELDVQTARSEALAAELKKAEANDADARCHVAELEARCEALAAENAPLKAAATTLVSKYMMNKGTDSEFIACITPSRKSIGTGGVWDMWRYLDLMLSKTPATDAFLAETRAQGVEMLGEAAERLMDEFGDDSYKVMVTADLQRLANAFAAQLRGNSNGGAL